MVVSDLYYMLVTISSINRLKASGEWDILRLTNVTPESLLRAKYAVAQTRAWRLLIVETALRLAAVVLAWEVFLSDMMPGNGLLLVSEALFLALLSAICLIEPLWRMRTLTAFGLAISAQIRDLPLATLGAFGGLLAVRILQILSLLVTVGGLTVVFAIAQALDRGLSANIYADGADSIVTTLAYVLGTAVIGAVIYGFYKRLLIFSINRAYYFAFQAEQ
jgi:hypothetical protein